MNEKVKTITILILLSFTCFLTQCKGCLDVNNKTNNIVPDQVVYTVSCGFPAPYFDTEIVTAGSSDKQETEERGINYYYRVKGSDMTGVSVPVNIAVMIALYAFLMFLASGKFIILNRLLNITLILILLFSSAMLLPYFPEILQQIAFYLYAYPVMAIQNLFEFLKLDAFKHNVSPRIYLVLLIILFYYLVPLAGKIKKKLFVR
ncbi:MAG TPA: hypothetical protein P5120_10200 [Spirochaetota bacterium]|nr:hypothetical protein [Spirochaetota bacterium]HRX47880.1 hypothetical protein [Spirochaetota bacterium]